MSFSDEMTLAEARDVLRTLVDEGHDCPCCSQLARVWRNKLDSAMARTLVLMLRHGAEHEFLHTPSLPGDNHKASQLRWWDLVQEELILRPDGGRAGHWRLTDRGAAFARGTISIPKYARVYDARVLGYAGESVTIFDCLGKRFDYYELLAGV